VTEYSRAPEVEKIATRLIRTVAEHKPLADAQIVYVWRDEATRSAGRITLAKARRVGGLNAFLINASAGLVDSSANVPLFVIEVARNTWARLKTAQRTALVDHELCHLRCFKDDDGELTLSLVGHDLEEFAQIVRRHGMWKADVALFGAEVAEQLALAVDEAAGFLDSEDGAE